MPRARSAWKSASLLTPVDGQGMTTTQMQLVNVLAGQTGGLFPVLFLTGGPAHGSGPYSSLFLDLDLGPGATRQLTWTQAATDTFQASFDLARQTAARPWEAERARLELLNSSQTIDIHTGDKDWDAAFALSQTAAFGLVLPTQSEFTKSIHGLCPRTQITDIHPKAMAEIILPPGMDNLRWRPTIWQAFCLPHKPRRTLLKNFLAIQSEDGSIDGKPGLAGQRGRYLATPLLVKPCLETL